MDALHPGHANRLLTYNQDPATPPLETSAGQELDRWYEETVYDILAPPITEAEIADPRLLFSSIAEPELLSLYGLYDAARLNEDPHSRHVAHQILGALPSTKVASEDFRNVEQFINNSSTLRRILTPGQGFLRSIVEANASTQNYRLSKGAIYTPGLADESDGVFDVQEVNLSDTAMLLTHEVLIRRLGAVQSDRFTALPLEYSRTSRWLEGKQLHFTDIDTARRYIGRLASDGCIVPRMNEPYQQGLLSILQNCSLFPDIIDRYRAHDREGFLAMQEKVAQIWTAPGYHGALAQCGFVFERDLLRYDRGEVSINPKLTRALAEFSSSGDATSSLRGRLHVPLYTGRRATVAFKPLNLPTSSKDATPIPGTLAFYPGISSSRQIANGRCPAVAKKKQDSSVITRMVGLFYDQSKSIETFCHEYVAPVLEIDPYTVLQLVDTPQFRAKIPTDERAGWVDAQDGDLIDNGMFRQPGYWETYLVETVSPLLLQLGRRALDNLGRDVAGH